MSCNLQLGKKLIDRVPFTCPYTQEEWRIIIIENVKNQIKNYKSIYHAGKN
jgi:hypothetical protein